MAKKRIYQHTSNFTREDWIWWRTLGTKKGTHELMTEAKGKLYTILQIDFNAKDFLKTATSKMLDLSFLEQYEIDKPYAVADLIETKLMNGSILKYLKNVKLANVIKFKVKEIDRKRKQTSLRWKNAEKENKEAEEYFKKALKERSRLADAPPSKWKKFFTNDPIVKFMKKLGK